MEIYRNLKFGMHTHFIKFQAHSIRVNFTSMQESFNVYSDLHQTYYTFCKKNYL